MQVVTTRYWWRRHNNVGGLLGWSRLNEIRLYGCIVLPRPWEVAPMCGFSVARWLDPDRGICTGWGYGVPMPRFREADELWDVWWDAVRRPWDEEPPLPVEEFHTPDEQKIYLDRRLDRAIDRLDHGKVLVMYLPYGGLPLVSMTRTDGKVILY